MSHRPVAAASLPQADNASDSLNTSSFSVGTDVSSPEVSMTKTNRFLDYAAKAVMGEEPPTLKDPQSSCLLYTSPSPRD